MTAKHVVRLGFMAALAVLPISACAASTSPQASTTSTPAASTSPQPSPQLRTFVAANFATARLPGLVASGLAQAVMHRRGESGVGAADRRARATRPLVP